ncbi:PH domain-containing protein [Lysobacter enzymogenes]|uniref:PH domain-containing protein n=1 Tax=Lysobacter enzymogenes TaxID=69 RepID=UPI001A95A684|nr:PH domain-containing protein [Lysobacter enzymogenes]QQP94657.1 PH domain-containing protein [Lysobacter enzymogenes]
MPLLFGFGALTCAATVVLVATAVYQHAWTAVTVLTLLFGGSGMALMLMAAPLEGDEDGLTVRRLHRHTRIAWSDIVAAQGDADRLLLRTRGSRESLLSYSYWRGEDRNGLYLLIREKFAAHGTEVAPRLRAFLRMDEDFLQPLPRDDDAT